MKIYTKTGDGGETGLFGGPRVSKDHVRIEAYGTVDELNAFLGAARTQALPGEVDAVVGRVQHCLFTIGAELATPNASRQRIDTLDESAVEALESAIDQLDAKLPPLREFILPAGTGATTALHVARAVCRRAERRIVTLIEMERESVSETTLRYINRLSDYLFVAARYCNFAAQRADEAWRKD